MTAVALRKGLLYRVAVREVGDKLREGKHSINSKIQCLLSLLPVYACPETHWVSWP